MATETAETAETAEPTNFKISLLGGNVFIPDSNKNFTGIALEVQIRNSGQPSIAIDWKLNIIRNGQPYPAQFAKPPPKLTLQGEKTGRIIVRRSNLQLPELAAMKPLRLEDTPIQGGILFYIRMPQADILAAETILELSVEDITGKRFFTRQKIGDWMPN